jgi:tRNA-specific adenosine deaminase 3
MDVYMTDEPCVMCAMALLHSRVRRAVYRRRDSEMGGLGSVESVHALSSTNHRFRAWRVVEDGVG